MPAAVYFAGGTVLYVAADPEAVVESIKAEVTDWTALTDIDGSTSIVHGNLVCFVGPIRKEELDADPTLAGKARRLATDTGEDRYPL